MSDMDIATLSLDEVIKQKGIKGGKFGGRRSAGGGGQRQRRDGGIQKPKRNPKMWDNDKFFESQGSRRRGSFGGGRTTSSGGKSIARLSNVPFNITQEDLNDLFAEYRLTRVALHYDFRGRSLGTAELHGPQNVISRLAREFKDVEIDGRPLGITVVNEGGSRGSSLGSRIRRVAGGAGRRSAGGDGPRGRRGAGGAKTGGKKKLTAEELDRELDEYMKGSTKD